MTIMMSEGAIPNPPASSEAARCRMQANRRRDTKPEVALRSALHRLGLRFFVDRPMIPGVRRRADIVFPRHRIAVYVDGCFWHGCPVHGTWPKRNASFWRDKIATNHDRDVETDRMLTDLGWTVIRVWEHEDPQSAAQRIEAIVLERRAASGVVIPQRIHVGDEAATNDLA